MEAVLAVVAGALFGSGIYMMLRRNLFRVIVGLALLSNAINLLIFTTGGLIRTRPPLIPPQEQAPPPVMADPLPQALILTAIVISFAVLAFTIVLFRRNFEALGIDDLAAMEKED